MASPVILLNGAGNPEPSPEVQRRLKRVHPGLSLRYHPGATTKHWMITMEWPREDPRWEMVRQQEMPRDASFDVIGYLPIGCSVDEAAPYLERSLRQHPKEEINRLIARSGEYARAGDTAEIQKASEEALDEVLSRPDPTSDRKVTGRRTRHLPKGD